MYYRTGGESLGEDTEFGALFSTGLSMFFASSNMIASPIYYFNAMDPVLEAMPEKDDGRYAFLKQHLETLADYSMIMYTGKSVGTLLNNKFAFYPDDNPAYGSKEKIDLDLVKEYWQDDMEASWAGIIVPFLSHRKEGVAGSDEWLSALIEQIKDDAVFAEDIEVTQVRYKDDTGYKIRLKEGSRRVIDSVTRDLTAELPVLEEYKAGLSSKDQKLVSRLGTIALGSREGTTGDFPEDATVEDYIKWYNEEGSTWDLMPEETDWYAVKDEAGDHHVASIYRETSTLMAVPALRQDMPDASDAERLVLLEFDSAADENGSHSLKSLYIQGAEGGPARLDPESLTREMQVLPIIYLYLQTGKKYYAPISKASFAINKDNAAGITLDMTDIRNIPDIEDIDGDGKSYTSLFTLRDMYGSSENITDKVLAEQDEKDQLLHMSLAEVEPAQYTGKELVPEIIYSGDTIPGLIEKGEVLKEGTDYTWAKVPVVIGEGEDEKFVTPDFKKAGDYEVLLTGKGRFTGFSYHTFTITKAANPLKVKGRTVKVSAGKLKKKSQKLAASRVLKFTKKGKGRLTYIKTSGAGKISVNKKTGKVTLKKGLKKGTYKVMIKVRAAGNSNYLASKTVKVTVKIAVK